MFPGLAVAEALQNRGCRIALMISEKEVDQRGARASAEMEIVKLPAVAMTRGQTGKALRAAFVSLKQSWSSFRVSKPKAVLAMGGFTSAGPILAGKALRLQTYVHESNSVPGRANRWLAPWVDKVFIGFSTAANRIHNRSVQLTGTPVRPQFQPSDPESSRMALGLAPDQPVLLVMGGSQGASAINEGMVKALPLLRKSFPELQYVHLTGPRDAEAAQAAYRANGCKAVVLPFLTEMEYALGAATLAISRAGASSLAEFAAMGVPALLIPYPSAADNHQHHNAEAFAQTGAAAMIVQRHLQTEAFGQQIEKLLRNPGARAAMTEQLRKWHYPNAAEEMAGAIMRGLEPHDVASPASRAVHVNAR